MGATPVVAAAILDRLMHRGDRVQHQRTVVADARAPSARHRHDHPERAGSEVAASLSTADPGAYLPRYLRRSPIAKRVTTELVLSVIANTRVACSGPPVGGVHRGSGQVGEQGRRLVEEVERAACGTRHAGGPARRAPAARPDRRPLWRVLGVVEVVCREALEMDVLDLSGVPRPNRAGPRSAHGTDAAGVRCGAGGRPPWSSQTTPTRRGRAPRHILGALHPRHPPWSAGRPAQTACGDSVRSSVEP